MPTKRIPLPFTGTQTKGSSSFSFLDSEECINYFPEVLDGKIILRGTPGSVQRASLGTNRGVMGSTVVKDLAFFVSNGRFFSLDEPLNVTQISSAIKNSSNNISFALTDDEITGTQLMLVDGTSGYVYNYGTETFTEITDPDFPKGARTVVQIDGYYLTHKPNTGRVYGSDRLDPFTWTALGFDVAGRDPGNIVAIGEDRSNLFLFEIDNAEIWYNASLSTATGGLTFARRTGAKIQYGLAAAFSIVNTPDGILWLANDADGDLVVIYAIGFQPAVISNDIADALKDLKVVDDAESWSYRDGEHVFCVWNFPTESQTFAYDLLTQKWHVRESRLVDAIGKEFYGRCRWKNHVYFKGRHLVGTYNNGEIHQLSRTVYKEGDDLIRARRTAKNIKNNQDLVTYYEIWFQFEPGVAQLRGRRTIDPQVELEVSYNGGLTFDLYQREPLGTIGDYDGQVRFQQLGQGRNFVGEMTITDPVKRDLYNVSALIEVDSA